jgi:hypothetical protein
VQLTSWKCRPFRASENVCRALLVWPGTSNANIISLCLRRGI